MPGGALGASDAAVGGGPTPPAMCGGGPKTRVRCFIKSLQAGTQHRVLALQLLVGLRTLHQLSLQLRGLAELLLLQVLHCPLTLLPKCLYGSRRLALDMIAHCSGDLLHHFFFELLRLVGRRDRSKMGRLPSAAEAVHILKARRRLHLDAACLVGRRWHHL